MNTCIIDYNKTSFDENELTLIRREVDVVRLKYPTYVPIVVRCKDKRINLIKNKFLVNGDITVGQLMYVIRKKIASKHGAETALFLFINNTLPTASTVVSSLYDSHHDEQTGMLFITLCQESTFG